jgi:MFS family permease
MTAGLSRNRDYRLLWAGQAVSEVGFSASLIAFPLLVFALTGSPVAAGLVLGADAAAQLVAGLPAGALADRWDRRRIMLGCEAVQALAAASLVAALVWGTAGLAHLVAVAVVMGVCRALFEPAEDACLPRLVPDHQLATAVSMNAARSSLGQMSGTALGGALFAVGRAVPFVVDLLAHLTAFVTLLFLRVPPREPVPAAGPPRLGRDIADGLRWVWRRPEIRVTAWCAVSLNLFFNAFYLVVIVLAQSRGVSTAEIGVMAAMLGAGGILGSLVAPYLHRRLSPHLAITGVFWALTALTPLALLVEDGYLMGALFATMALLAPTANTTINTHQLLLTPDELRGRLAGAMGVATGIAAALGPAMGGLLLQFVPGDRAVLVCAAGIAAVTVLVTVNPTLRAYPRPSRQRKDVLT